MHFTSVSPDYCILTIMITVETKHALNFSNLFLENLAVSIFKAVQIPACQHFPPTSAASSRSVKSNILNSMLDYYSDFCVWTGLSWKLKVGLETVSPIWQSVITFSVPSSTFSTFGGSTDNILPYSCFLLRGIKIVV